MTLMAMSDSHIDSAFFKVDAGSARIQIAFASGHLYLLAPGFDAIVRTLNPYCIHNASDFTTNPLVTMLDGDDWTQVSDFVVEPQSDAMIVDMLPEYETSSVDSVYMQYQQVGSGKHLGRLEISTLRRQPRATDGQEAGITPS
jgi:hypothetical protein